MLLQAWSLLCPPVPSGPALRLRLYGFNFSQPDGSGVPKDLGTGSGMLNSVLPPFYCFSAKVHVSESVLIIK